MDEKLFQGVLTSLKIYRVGSIIFYIVKEQNPETKFSVDKLFRGRDYLNLPVEFENVPVELDAVVSREEFEELALGNGLLAQIDFANFWDTLEDFIKEVPESPHKNSVAVLFLLL